MSFYICSNCGYGLASWLGKCPECGEFNTLRQQRDVGKDQEEPTRKMKLQAFSNIQKQTQNRIKTGVFEFDRVIGRGLVPGEVILLSGEPGVGKSTLLLQVLSKLKTIYISGEESPEQVTDRASRLKINSRNFLFSDESQVESIIEGVREHGKIEVLVIDSVQTMYSKKAEGPPGAINQLKETASQLIAFAKESKKILILIGHITKGGEIAGPKSLEHLVDCVLNFEGEKVSNFRLLRSTKNRFGATDEIGIFEMIQNGLKEVTNPLVFLEDQKNLAPGKAIIGVAEGKRSLFFEIQILAVPTVLAVPRRVVKGLDYNKTLLLIAVARKFLGLPLDKFDIYANIVGGVSVKSTSSDLGFIAALISAFTNTALPKNSSFIGEVGLLGEIRTTYFENKVTHEARRMGFRKIYSSANVSHVQDLKKMLK